MQHLKVFGCVCYSQVPKEKRAKLDEKVEVGVFMVYNNNVKGYRIYQPLKKKLIINRDVNFDENAVWNWNDEARIEFEKEIDVSDDKSETAEVEVGEDDFDDRHVRGFRSLTDVY